MVIETKYSKYEKRAKELGAKDAKIIPADSVVTAEWVRIKCQFGCSGFAKRLTCPPNSPTPDQTKKMLSFYKYALLLHSNDTNIVKKIVPILEREIFFDGYFKAFGIGEGPCNLCESCEEFCKKPREARPSMESCGIDVFTTVRAHGYHIDTLRTRDEIGNYYGLVLIE